MASYVKILFNILICHLYIFFGEVVEIIYLILNELLGFCCHLLYCSWILQSHLLWVLILATELSAFLGGFAYQSLFRYVAYKCFQFVTVT